MNIEAARAALEEYTDTRNFSDSFETDVIDLMTDLLHLYAEDGSNASALLSMVTNHWEAERRESGQPFYFCPRCLYEWSDPAEKSECPQCGTAVTEDAVIESGHGRDYLEGKS